MATLKKERLGETQMNEQGLTMKIVKYHNNKDIEVRFLETGEVRNTTYYKFSKGKVVANLHAYPVLDEKKAKSLWRTLFILIIVGLVFTAALIIAISKWTH